ncbi:MAG: hypothetical protein ACM3VV_03890 [Deltaproteobacteria bacterium]
MFLWCFFGGSLPLPWSLSLGLSLCGFSPNADVIMLIAGTIARPENNATIITKPKSFVDIILLVPWLGIYFI